AAAGENVSEGKVGAGAGCTVGKLYGRARAMRGGQGTASVRVAGRCTVGVLIVVNAVGDVVDPGTGRVIAGTRGEDGVFVGPEAWLAPPDPNTDSAGALPAKGGSAGGINSTDELPERTDDPPDLSDLNTTIGVVSTDAPLTKEQAQRVAWMAHDGLARAIRPAHTLLDGDTLFVLATGRAGRAAGDMASPAADKYPAPLTPRAVSAIGAAAADVVVAAIVRAVRAATSLPGLPAARQTQR
ncbi:MAG: P1 family peptidase, partial [Chloroflexota bacterium]